MGGAIWLPAPAEPDCIRESIRSNSGSKYESVMSTSSHDWWGAGTRGESTDPRDVYPRAAAVQSARRVRPRDRRSGGLPSGLQRDRERDREGVVEFAFVSSIYVFDCG